MSIGKLKGGNNFEVLGKIKDPKCAAEGVRYLKMSSDEKKAYHLEQALSDIIEAVKEYDDDEEIPVRADPVPDGCVVLHLEDLQRWVCRLIEMPNFILNDEVTKLLIDMISTEDACGNQLDLMPPDAKLLRLVQ